MNLPPAYESRFNPTTDITVQRLIDANSTADDQQPTGLGIANAITVEFGAAVTTDAVDLDSLGFLTFKESGMYGIKASAQFGRSGSASVSELLFRFVVNGAQAGRSVAAKLNNANVLNYIDIDTTVNISEDTVVSIQVMRDSSGHDSGGLFKVVPTDEGAGTWNDVPCASIRVERYV